jgi:hypothetical protein
VLLYKINGGQQEFKEGFFDLFYSVFSVFLQRAKIFYLSKLSSKIIFVLLLVAISCKSTKGTVISDDKQINTLLDWHKAAADAKYDTYFGKMTRMVFIGTDATENWVNPPFKHLPNLILIKGRHGILQYWNVIFIFDKRNGLV